MSVSKPLAKAKLVELTAEYTEKSGGMVAVVQFNPDSLKVTYNNQIVEPKNAGGENSTSSGDQSNQASRQFVGAGTTKLALSLWFDVGSHTGEGNAAGDVRDLTKKVAYFITPKKEGENYIPPAVSFQWGSFKFDGLMDSLEETLEFFSDQGVPLRASMSLSLSQQRIVAFSGNNSSLASRSPMGKGGAAPGTTPLAQTEAAVNLQNMAAKAGKGTNWQAIAEANGIENPRLLRPGQFINLNVKGNYSPRVGSSEKKG
jgi:hypothetical protein